MKNGGKRGQREIGHGVGRVFAPPPVGHGLAAAAQRGNEAVLDLHPHVESEIALRANRANRIDSRLPGGRCICDSPGRPGRPTDRHSDRINQLKRRTNGQMRTADFNACLVVRIVAFNRRR
jgi:hypothetical protein